MGTAAAGTVVRRRLEAVAVDRAAIARVGEALAVGLLAIWAVHARTRDLSAPLWIDEGISIGIARHGLGAIPGLLRQDGAPPLFYVILHGWVGLFGASARSCHVLTLIFAVLAIPAAWWAARVPFGPWAAVLAAAIVALDPFAGMYAVEVRMYSLLLLTGLLATGALLRAFVAHPGHRGWAAAFAVALAAVMYTHNWGLFYALAAGIVWLGIVAASAGRRRPVVLSGLIGFGGALVLWAPWVPTVLEQTKHTGAPWSHAPSWNSVGHALERLSGGSVPETVLLLFALAGAVTLLRTRRSVAGLGIVAVVLLAAGTFAIAFAWSNLGSPAWALRYLALVLAPGAIAVAAGLSRLGAMAAVVLAVLFLSHWYGEPTHASLNAKSNVEHVARRLAHDLPNGSLVWSTQPEQVPALRYYLGARLRFATPLGMVPDPQVMDWRDAMARLDRPAARERFGAALAHLRPGQRILLVQPHFAGATAPWTRRIHLIAHEERRALRDAGHRIRIVAHISPHRGYSRSTVSAIVLERSHVVGRHGSAS